MPRSCSWSICLLLVACAGPAPGSPPGFVLGVQAPPSPAASPEAGTPRPEPTATSDAPVVAPATAPSVTGGSGGSGGNGSGAPGPAFPDDGPYFFMVGQPPLPGLAADEVPLPAGASGETSLFAPGRVPSTLVLAAGAEAPAATHPRPNTLAGPAGGPATLVGVLGQGSGGARVRFAAPSRLAAADTPASPEAAFSLAIPLANGEPALVVAVDAAVPPRLGLARVSPAEGDTLDVGSLPLLAPAQVPAPAPVPPGPLLADLDELLLADGAGPGRPLLVLATRGQPLVTYPVPGASWLLRYNARDPAGNRSSAVCGPPTGVPAFLAPPDLAGLPATLSPGTALAWPAVAGATLYTVRLIANGIPDPPVWEGVSPSPRITLPAPLRLPSGGLALRVEAWDAPDVTIYSLASLPRRLRLPTDEAHAGRFSAATRRY